VMSRIPRIVLEALPRLTAAIVLWENIDLLLRLLPRVVGGPIEFLSALASLEGLPTAIGLASSVLAALTVATASPMLYAVTLSILAVAKGAAGYAVSPASIFGMLVILFSDTLRPVYRTGQGASLRLGYRDLVKGVVGAAAILGMVILVAVGAGLYVGRFIDYMVSAGTRAVSKNLVLAGLLMNPVVRLIVVLVFTLLFYKLLTHAFDSAALFAFPSRRLSIQVLRDRSGIDASIEIPLNTLRGMIIAMAVAPLLYASIYRVVIPLATQLMPQLGLLTTFVARVAITFLLFTVAYTVVSRFINRFLEGSPESVLGIAVGVAVFVYACAVLRSVWLGAPLVRALTSPDLEGLGRDAVDSYVKFYALFFYLVELLLRLVGAAP